MRLVTAGVSGLVSFGFAGGLDPALRPGDLLVPSGIFLTAAELVSADPELSDRLGGGTGHRLLAGHEIIVTAAEKSRARVGSGCAAVDLESGAVARAAAARGLPFAALRAICDPADRTLPPAALIALSPSGRVTLGRVAGSVLAHPGQIPALIALGRDAGRARAALLRRVRSLV